MRFLLTSAGITNTSIENALVDLLGKPIAESDALCIPTGVQPFPGGPSHVYRFISGSAPGPMCELGWKSLGVLELTALPSIEEEHGSPRSRRLTPCWFGAAVPCICATGCGSPVWPTSCCRCGDPPRDPILEPVWLEPYPDRLLDDLADPAARTRARDDRARVLAAIQLLPPRQRAILVLRDVLEWSGAAVAALLGTRRAQSTARFDAPRATIERSGIDHSTMAAPHRRGTRAPRSIRSGVRAGGRA
jgi:Sigma-70, region 4